MLDDQQYDETGERLWAHGPSQAKYGLQGTATVLELRRIQEAFDREFSSHRKNPPARNVTRPDERPVQSKRRKRRERAKKKSVMGKMVNACLQGLGFGSSEQVEVVDRQKDQREASVAKRPGPRPSARMARPIEEAPFRIEAVQPVLEDLEEELAVMLSMATFPPESSASNSISSIPRIETQVSPAGRANDAVSIVRQVRDRLLPAQRAENIADASKLTRAAVNQAVGKGLEQARRGYRFLIGASSGAVGQEAQNAQLQARLAHSLENEFRTGLRMLVAGVAIFGGWGALIPLASAIVTPGVLVAESNIKKVQHSTGGVVAQILARDGTHVREGDTLVRLDETQTRTNRQMVMAQLNQVRVRIARLVAERDGAKEPSFPIELATMTGDKDIEQLLSSERSQFNARATSRKNQKELLRSHITQLEGEISGLDAQIKAKATQIELIVGELKGVQGLFEKHLVPIGRLTNLQREAARLGGEQAQMSSAITEAQSKINEAKLQIDQIDQSFRSEVLKELRESQDKEVELAERGVVAKDQLDRVDIRAPTSGVVHQLSIHTVGGVISPAEVIMEIVPDSDELQIEARLPPNEIDHVRSGQKSMVRFSAFNQRTTPQLEGVVSYVSADLARDKQTNAAYYTVRVTLPGDQRRRLGELQLVSGMPAEVFLQTGSRTMMSYLLKPISDQLERSFNEP